MSKSSRITGPVFALWSAAVLAALLLAVLIWGLDWMVNRSGWAPAEVVLAPMVLIAVVVLTLALGALTVVMSRLKLSDQREALGLPAGSIRAILALLLTLLFLVISIYLFGQLKGGQQPSEALEGVTRAELAEIPLDEQISRELTSEPGERAVYTVVLQSPNPEAVENFALQLVTTLSTLVVAVAAFYFGSRSMETAVATTRGRGSRGRSAGGPPPPLAGVSGRPGSWFPEGVMPPKSLEALRRANIRPHPTSTAWDEGEYVNLGDGSRVSWNGAKWRVISSGTPVEEELSGTGAVQVQGATPGTGTTGGPQ